MNNKFARTVVGGVAVLAAAMVAAPASAVPLVTSNIRPATINPGPSSEGTVQSILNTVFGVGAVSATADQSTANVFASSTFPASTIPTLVVEYSGNAANNTFGIWFGSDTSNILTIDLLLGGANTTGIFPSAASIQFAAGAMQVGGFGCGVAINCGVFFDSRISSGTFGFYLDVGNGTRYYSADQLNGGTARMLAYEGSPTNWLFAFEDGTDFDYNDMAIKIESIKRAPEPGTLALLGFGLLGLGAASRRRSRKD